MKRVLVTGGAGYIGSHACKLLARQGYIPVTFDSLVTGWASAVKFGPFVQGDLLSDFIAAAGLPQLEYKRPPRANESLNRVGIELLRRFNGEVPVFLPDGRVNPMRGGILPFFEEHFRAGKSFLPRAQTIAAYEAAFAESNEWVRKTFFPQRAQLFKPVAGAATGDAGLSPQELDQMAGLTAELWRQWRRKMLETPKKHPVP